MADIPFTQYLLPNGRRQTVWVGLPDTVADKAQQIMDAGFCFECEMLSDMTTISLTVADADGDHAIELCPNGPEVLTAIERMILSFDPAAAKARGSGDSDEAA